MAPSGDTYVSSLADSQQLIIDSARIRREYTVVMPGLAEQHNLSDNTDSSWEEVELNRFNAQTITDTTILDNAQEFADTVRAYTPTQTGITTIQHWKVAKRLPKVVLAQMGSQMMDAIDRKKDLDGFITLDGATNSQPGAGNTLTSGVLSAHVSNIQGNTTEGATGAINHLLHPFQWKDVQDEFTAGIGTYPIPTGMTAEVFARGFKGPVFDGMMHTAGNVPIITGDDAKGATFAKMGLLYIKGRGLTKFSKTLPERGGGSEQFWLYDEYTFGERLSNSTSVFIRETFSDATAPTV
jgi:hypothetical protein